MLGCYIFVGDVFLLKEGQGEGERLDQFLDIFQHEEFVSVETVLQKHLQSGLHVLEEEQIVLALYLY